MTYIYKILLSTNFIFLFPIIETGLFSENRNELCSNLFMNYKKIILKVEHCRIVNGSSQIKLMKFFGDYLGI